MFFLISDVKLDGSTVIVPSTSVGNVPQLAVDLLINTLKPLLVGYIHHEELIPIVGPNAYNEKSNYISSACEVYYLAAHRLVFLQMRGAVVPGCEKSFSKDLIDWMIGFNAKKLITIISVAAEIRKDKDLQGCQIRYALPTILKEELEAKFINHGWSEYEVPEGGDVEELGASDSQIYVPSGGFGQHLYDIGNQRGLPSVGTLMFAYEGDNESEALAMADAVNLYISVEKMEWKKPVSWGLLYGNGPPPEIY